MYIYIYVYVYIIFQTVYIIYKQLIFIYKSYISYTFLIYTIYIYIYIYRLFLYDIYIYIEICNTKTGFVFGYINTCIICFFDYHLFSRAFCLKFWKVPGSILRTQCFRRFLLVAGHLGRCCRGTSTGVFLGQSIHTPRQPISRSLVNSTTDKQ